MPLICTSPGGSTDPLQQSRKVGAYVRLSDLTVGFEFPDVIAEAIKQEFLKLMLDFNAGLPIRIVRSLPPTEVVTKHND